MQNKMSEGKTLDYTNSTTVAISAGDVVAINDFCGVAVNDIAASGTGPLALSGEFKLDATNSAAFAIGEQLYWDATEEELVKTSTGNTKIGMCTRTKASSGTTGYVNLNVNA